MELSLNKNDPINTVFMTPDGRPMYHVNTASKVFGTGDTKIMNVWEKTTDIGMIEWHSWSDSVILVGRRRVTPDKSGTFSSSQSFTAADGRAYKWKIDGGLPLLVVDDHSHTPVAVFTKAKSGWFSTPRLASLNITPQGTHILDDIITTFVWFEHKRRQRERSRRNGATTAAAAS